MALQNRHSSFHLTANGAGLEKLTDLCCSSISKKWWSPSWSLGLSGYEAPPLHNADAKMCGETAYIGRGCPDGCSEHRDLHLEALGPRKGWRGQGSFPEVVTPESGFAM